jgi:hypothetical protein
VNGWRERERGEGERRRREREIERGIVRERTIKRS